MFFNYEMLESAWNYKLELLDISSVGIIVEGVTDLDSFKNQFKILQNYNTKLFTLSKSSIYLVNNMTYREFRQFKNNFEDSHFNVYSVFVKDSFFDDIVATINLQTTGIYQFQESLYYLCFQAKNFSPNFLNFIKATDIKIFPTSPPYFFYGFQEFIDVLKAYAFLIKDESNWPIFAVTNSNLDSFKKFEFSKPKSEEEEVNEKEIVKEKNISLTERLKSNYPPFNPSKYFHYIGFIEKVIPSPQRIKNVDELYFIKEINDVQISHVYQESSCFTLRTFLGFESEFRCLHVFDYFRHLEDDLKLIFDVILITEIQSIKFNVRHDLFYLEVPKIGFDSTIIFSINYFDYNVNNSSSFYSFDNEDDFECAFQFLNEPLNSTEKILITDVRTIDRNEFNDKFDPQLSARLLKTKFFYLVLSVQNENSAELKPILKSARFYEKDVSYASNFNELKYSLYGFSCSDDREKAYFLLRKSQNSKLIQWFFPEKISDPQAFVSENKNVSIRKVSEENAKSAKREQNEKKAQKEKSQQTNVQDQASTQNIQKEENEKSSPKQTSTQNVQSVKSSPNSPKQASIQNSQKEKSTQNTQSLKSSPNASKQESAQVTPKDKKTQNIQSVKNSPNLTKQTSFQTPQKDKNTQIDSINKSSQKVQKEISPLSTQIAPKSDTTINNESQQILSKSKDSIQPKPSKAIAINPVKSESQVQTKKVNLQECFSPNKSLIYFYFIEREKARQISPGKQIKLTLFGVKKCKDIQRYKKLMDSIEQDYFTFFGFEKYDEVTSGIEVIKSKSLSEGTINIYEHTTAFEKYQQNPNNDDEIDLEQELFLQALREKNQSQQLLQIKNPNLKITINNVRANTFTDICNQSSDFYCFCQTSVPNNIQFEIKKTLNKMKTIKNILKDVVPHFLVYEPYTFIFVDLKDQVNDTLFRNVFSNHKIRVVDLDYDSDQEKVHYLTFEEKVLPINLLKKFLSFLEYYSDITEIRRNVFHMGKIVTMFFFDCQKSQTVLNNIEKCFVNDNILFDLKKYSLKRTIHFNEEVTLLRKDDFDIILNEIKSIGIVPINVERNKLILIKKPILANNLFQMSSFICFKCEKDKMLVLNRINPIVLKYRENVLKLNTSLHYIKIDPSKCFHQAMVNPQILFINAMNSMSGILDFQQNVFSIECPIELTYIGFSSEKLMYFYNKVFNFRLNYISLFPNSSFFKPDENMHYIRYRIKTEDQFEDLFDDDVMLRIDEIQRNCTVFENEIQFLTYIGFKEKSDRNYVANAMKKFMARNPDVLVFGIVDFDEDIDIDEYDQMTSECILNLINEKILVQ